MKKFLIEVPHEATKEACEHAIQVFKESGSHFLTHADWGCKDNVHKAWIIVDVDSKHDAENIVPSYYRESSSFVELTRLSANEDMMDDKYHHA